MYPENTITAFSKAIEIEGLTGIELDIQMTKYVEIVVIHDERVDRTTDGTGYVKDFTYLQLRKLAIGTGTGRKETIPAIQEVLDLIQSRMKEGLLLNIELKNSEIPYDGMEEKIMELAADRGLQGQVVYSSFCIKSLERLKELDPDASIGILDQNASDCMYKKKSSFGEEDGRVALHPFWKNMDITKKELSGQTVRAWMSECLYPEKAEDKRLDLGKLEAAGITDVFLNRPEVYLRQREW